MNNKTCKIKLGRPPLTKGKLAHRTTFTHHVGLRTQIDKVRKVKRSKWIVNAIVKALELQDEGY